MLAVVTTCRDREHHLRMTLPMLSAQDYPIAEKVMVGYNETSDSLAELCREHQFDLHYVMNRPEQFNLARARNFGAVQLVGDPDYILFMDADTMLRPHSIAVAMSIIELDELDLLVLKGADPYSAGTLIVHKDAFFSVRGYNESFQDWGGEDQDFVRRMVKAGYVRQYTRPNFIHNIAHPRSESVTHYTVKNCRVSFARNLKLYGNQSIDEMNSCIPKKVLNG